MHLHLVYTYHNSQNMIAIVAAQPNVVLGRQDRFAPQME
jgi:hypothetical protein